MKGAFALPFLGTIPSTKEPYAGKMRQDSKGREKPDKLLRHIRRVRYLRENAQRLGERLGLTTQPRIHGLMVVDAPQPMNFYMLEETPDAHSCPLEDLIENISNILLCS